MADLDHIRMLKREVSLIPKDVEKDRIGITDNEMPIRRYYVLGFFLKWKGFSIDRPAKGGVLTNPNE